MTVSWQGRQLPPPKFWAVGRLPENFFLSKNSSKNAKLGVEKPEFGGNLGTKLKS